MQQHYPLNPATGVEDPSQLPWINGNPSTGAEGSFPPFALCTEPMYEVVNVIEQAGLTPTSADVTQLYQAILKLIASAVGGIKLPDATGAGEGNTVDANGNIAWSIPGLTDEETISATDLIAFQQMVAGEGGLVAGHARKMPFSTFAAAILNNPTLILNAINSVKAVNPLPNIVNVEGIVNIYSKIVWNNAYGSMEGYGSISLSGQDHYDFTLPVQFTTDEKYTVVCQDVNNLDYPPGGPGAHITGAPISGGVIRLFVRNVDGSPWIGQLGFHYICEGHQ